MPTENLIELAAREFARLKRLADGAMVQVDDDAFFAHLDRDDNSIAVIVKHLAGNMRSRWTDFLTTDGEKPDRHRDGEFEIADTDSRNDLMAHWETGWAILLSALEPLTEADANREVLIRGEPLTVLQAVTRQLTHYAYHAGQIVLLARHYAGETWETLSVPKGGTVAFNKNPTPYIEKK